MLKRLPIGFVDFKDLKEKGYYFVDKTLLIQDFLNQGSKVTLVTRPRRFGKSINMSMLAEFFDITKDSKKLFEDTKIMDTPYVSKMNQYPVIYMTFANAKRDKRAVIETIKKQILNEWDRYEFVFENLGRHEQIVYDNLENVLIDFNSDTLVGINDAIAFLMERLYEYYDKEVMVFIDEYDTPFIEAHVNGFYDDVRGGLAGLLHNSLKNSTCLKFAYLTGIQRIAKENIFSDVNNVDVYTMAHKEYSSYFGFTTEETKELLEYYGLELTDEVKQMYDGYKIGNQDIYNPWSIMNYASRKELEPYWVNTSAITMVRNALQAVIQKDSTFKDQYDELIVHGKTTETKVALDSSFYELASSDTLWGLLINAGYLTIEENLGDDEYVIRIPNKEVRKDFIRLTESYLSLNDGQLNHLMKLLIREKKERFIKEYKRILMLPSYHDLKDENSYHMMMLGMSVCLCDDYEIISNREEGRGRCDLILKSKDTNKTSFVLEFKYLKEDVSNIEERLEKLSSQAIQQIIDNKYDNDLADKVIYIGLAHHRKEVDIKWVER